MRVCLISKFFDFRGGGLGRVAMELRDGLEKEGVDVVCIGAPDSAYRSLGIYFLYTFTLIPYKILSLPPCDIYHALTPMESLFLPKRTGVSTIQDLNFWLYSKLGGTDLNRGMLSKAKLGIGRNYFKFGVRQATKAKKVVTSSWMVKEQLRVHTGREDVRVIRLGINGKLEPKKKKDKVFRLGYLGQLDRRKRVHELLRTYRGSGLRGELVIGGLGLDEEWFRREAGRDSRIKFLGEIPESRLCDFYNSLDYFMFPTMVEGYGLPIVEAMACRKPVVVLRDAVIPQEVKGRCIIVEDLGEFFYELGKVGTFGDGKLLDSNYLFAKEHSWETCVKEYIKVYEEVLGLGGES